MTFEEFSLAVSSCLDLPYEFSNTRSTYEAVARKDLECGLVGIAWMYDTIQKSWTVNILEIKDGDRILMEGQGQTPKEAFANRGFV